MKIALDLRFLSRPDARNRGIGVHAYNHIKALLELHTDYTFYVIGYRDVLTGSFESLFEDADNVTHVLYPLVDPSLILKVYSRFQWLDRFFMDRFLRKNEVDVLLSYSSADIFFRMPQSDKYKAVYFFHDMIPYLFEEKYLPLKKDKRFYRSYLDQFLHADGIIAISETSKRDLVSHVGVSEEKVAVIGHGVKELGEVESVQLDSDVIEKGFVFYSGGFDFRKNVMLLAKAFCASSEVKKQGTYLVLTGWVDDKAEKLLAKLRNYMKKHDLEDRLVVLGYVSDGQLKYLFSEAKAFIFPSLYEGFGLPIIESIWHGCPVIAARNSSLAEFDEKMVIFFDDNSIDNLSAQIDGLLSGAFDTDSMLSYGKHIISEQYTWDSSAKKTVSYLQQLVS